MKKFMLGFLIGALLFSIMPINAAIQQYTLQQSDCKLVVDGNEFKSDMPLLNYDGYNYLPAAGFREICDKLNIGFEFDNETKEIRIITSNKVIGKEGDTAIMNDVYLNKYGLPVFYEHNGEKPKLENDGTYTFFIYNGIKYISIQYEPEATKKLLPDGYSFRCPIIDGKVGFDIQLRSSLPGPTDIIIDEIPYALYGSDRDYFISYDYYINAILPLVKEGAK